MSAWIIRGAIIAAVTVLAVAARGEDACVTCHPEVKAQYERSVHGKRFGCISCHGGDATAASLDAHAPDKGYVGKPARKDIPFLCASCHADVERMRASGLATDQYALYQRSEHGVRLAAGDTRVAVCTDCHGSHRILPHSEPTSSVSPRNVPATCARCHSNAQLMENYHLRTDQFEKFSQSVHGVALYADEHPSAPTCASCHGAHGVSDGNVVTRACGQCHPRTREYVDQGAHRQAVDAGKMSECISCHRYHDTMHPDEKLFDTACPTCHAADSTAMRTAEKLKTVLLQTNESLDSAAAEIEQLKTEFPTVVRARARLRQAEAYRREALPVQHALNVDRVEDLTRSARSISDDVRSGLHGVEQQHGVRRLWLAILWVYVIGVLGVLYAYRQERRRDRVARRPDAGQQ